MQGVSFEEFVARIKEYESDTFSAEGSEITDAEARQVAEVILANWIDEHLDGVRVDAVLDGIRNL